MSHCVVQRWVTRRTRKQALGSWDLTQKINFCVRRGAFFSFPFGNDDAQRAPKISRAIFYPPPAPFCDSAWLQGARWPAPALFPPPPMVINPWSNQSLACPCDWQRSLFGALRGPRVKELPGEGGRGRGRGTTVTQTPLRSSCFSPALPTPSLLRQSSASFFGCKTSRRRLPHNTRKSSDLLLQQRLLSLL